MCIPHTKKMHLEKVRNNYFARSNDLIQGKTENSATAKISFKNLQADYDAYSFYPNASFVAGGDVHGWPGKEAVPLPSSPTVSLEHPPESV
jgi:hypothetical protein